MTKDSTVFNIITEQGILPLYYYDDAKVSVDILRALYKAGIRAVEYADRGETALNNFQMMRQVCDLEFKDLQLGIGTIQDGESAQAYIDAGTDFIVSPGLVESVARIATANNMLLIPGCMTPTEIICATELGSQMIKLYPLTTFGIPFFEAIKAVFPDLLFMPTGGIEVDDDTVTSWFKAGGGGKLITRPILEDRLYDKLTDDTQHVLELIQSIRRDSVLS